MVGKWIEITRVFPEEHYGRLAWIRACIISEDYTGGDTRMHEEKCEIFIGKVYHHGVWGTTFDAFTLNFDPGDVGWIPTHYMLINVPQFPLDTEKNNASNEINYLAKY